jgi:hypothetical protein
VTPTLALAVQGRALDGLRALRKQQVSTKLLQDTQAGKRVRALSKHADAGIAKLAAEVVAAWKELVRREAEPAPSSSTQQQAASKSEGGYRSEGNGATGGGSQPSSAAAGPSSSQATSGEARPAGGVAAAAAAEFDGAALAKSGDPVRDKCRLNLGIALQVGPA